MKKACFTFEFDTNEEAKVIADSIYPEIKKRIPKTKVETKLSEKNFSIIIHAEDLSSLRAAINSYLRWINTALSVKKTV